MEMLFLLLSPTFGMHQYTADLANRLAAAGERVHLLTTVGYPADRYAPGVQVHTPVRTRDSGFSLRGARTAPLAAIMRAIDDAHPDVVHITGPHLWNVPVLRALARRGVPTVHTLHDLQPHPGSPYGSLLLLWNRQVLRHADQVVVHARAACAAARRLDARAAVTPLPLLHGFWGYTLETEAGRLAAQATPPEAPLALFFGRIERYKGLDVLLTAWTAAHGRLPAGSRLVLAGRGELARLWRQPLPPGVEVVGRHIADREALGLFAGCSLLVLPYTGATQTALVAAAAHFRKPVVVSNSGALAEDVVPGENGWVVPAGDSEALAGALVAALGDPDRLMAMGVANRAWYDATRRVEWEMWRALYARLIVRGG